MHGHKAAVHKLPPFEYPPFKEVVLVHEYTSSLGEQMLVSPWAVKVSNYEPEEFTHDVVKGQPEWADPADPAKVDGGIGRRQTFEGNHRASPHVTSSISHNLGIGPSPAPLEIYHIQHTYSTTDRVRGMRMPPCIPHSSHTYRATFTSLTVTPHTPLISHPSQSPLTVTPHTPLISHPSQAQLRLIRARASRKGAL